MNADAKPDWQDVERQGVALIDKSTMKLSNRPITPLPFSVPS
jgi:hypothetical protein